jgi:hypothetical protein
VAVFVNGFSFLHTQADTTCEGSKVPAAVYRRVLNMRVNKPISRQKHTSILRSLPPFYAWVAARLLHKVTYPRDSSR